MQADVVVQNGVAQGQVRARMADDTTQHTGVAERAVEEEGMRSHKA